MSYNKIVLLLFIFLCITSVTTAQANTNELNFEVGKLDGETLYTISGSDSGGWKSKLLFPLTTKLITINYGTKFEQLQWGLTEINFSLSKNLDNKNNGLMKDSDWI